MKPVTRAEAEAFQVYLYYPFPMVDITVSSRVVDHGQDTEVIRFVGEYSALEELEDVHLPKLLGQGDGSYRWIGARRIHKGELALWFKKLKGLFPPRVELVERVLRRDIVVLADLVLNPHARLTVINPWDVMIRCGELPLPVETNGHTVLGMPDLKLGEARCDSLLY